MIGFDKYGLEIDFREENESNFSRGELLYIEPLTEHAYAMVVLDLEPSVRHTVKSRYSSSMLLMMR